MALNSTVTTPIPNGPRQNALALTVSYTVSAKGVVENFFGSIQPFIANTDGTNPLLLGNATPVAPASDPAAAAFQAAVLAAAQVYITAKGL
jgi:hypothetical protein